MNYLWEVALNADDNNVLREKLNYQPAEIYSPYMEASFVELNEKCIEEQKVEVNPLYRFTNIFGEIFNINLNQCPKTRELFFDVCMQYMIQIDLREGLTKSEYYLRFILRDILQESFGSQAKETIQKFNHLELRKILVCILDLYTCSTSINLFKKVIKAVYPESIVYSNNEVFRELLIYIGVKETENERKKINFLLEMFLPINYETHLFWDKHFGIIDIEKTMELDEMLLF